MGMTAQVNGQDVPVGIAYGVCHQIVRSYGACETDDGHRYAAGSTTNGLPWFREFQKAVDFLEGRPFAGYIQTYVMKEDGSGPSWITAGIHYMKDGGEKEGPLGAVKIAMSVFDEEWYEIKHLAARIAMTNNTLHAMFEIERLSPDECGRGPAKFVEAVLLAKQWCCTNVVVDVHAGDGV